MNEREESFIETALNEMYEKAERENSVPWNDAEPEVVTLDGGRVVIIRDIDVLNAMLDAALAEQEAELKETFPEEP